jgi:hypothetical protein
MSQLSLPFQVRRVARRSGSRDLFIAWCGSLVLHTLALIVLVLWPTEPQRGTSIYGSLDADAGEGQPSARLIPAPTTSQTQSEPLPADFLHLTSRAADGAGAFPGDGVTPDLSQSPLGFGGDPQPGQASGFPVIGLSGGEEGWILPGGSGGTLEGTGLGLHQAGSAPAFFGAGAGGKAVTNVVYVVDRSSSMLDTFDFVRAELTKSISSLRRSQRFHVIFFNAGPLLENPPERLVHAIEGNRKAFFEFLETVTPTGSTDPLPAMYRAFELKPDLIYLLSDGLKFPPDILQRLDVLNRSRDTVISTIAYLDPLGRQILEQIAREQGGEFVFVSGFDE